MQRMSERGQGKGRGRLSSLANRKGRCMVLQDRRPENVNDIKSRPSYKRSDGVHIVIRKSVREDPPKSNLPTEGG